MAGSHEESIAAGSIIDQLAIPTFRSRYAQHSIHGTEWRTTDTVKFSSIIKRYNFLMKFFNEIFNEIRQKV